MDVTPSTTTTLGDTPAVLPYRRANLGDRPDDCYRCGYPLLGIDDERPCPECGLLARRSRRQTDELHNTRPRWLKRISRGANLILLAIVIAGFWGLIWNTSHRRYSWYGGRSALRYAIPDGGYALAMLILPIGTWLLASREHYLPADEADRRLRRWLRVWGFVPAFAFVLPFAWQVVMFRTGYRYLSAYPGLSQVAMALFTILLTVGIAPLPLLLFRRLRGLAKRARSAHLAEHCAIVGIGMSAAMIWAALLAFLSDNARRWGLGTWWIERSNIAMAIMLVLGVGLMLFTFWSLYLLIRFTIAFRRAARQLQGKWTSDDRALTPHGSAAAPPG